MTQVAHAFFALALALNLTVVPTVVSQTSDERRPPTFSKDQIAEAEKLIKDVFQQEYTKAKTDSEVRLQLANTLLQQSNDIKQDDDVRYVALREAIRLAAQAGAVDKAFSAVKTLAKYHQIDNLGRNADVFLYASDTLASMDNPKEIAMEALKIADKAILEDRYELAVKVGAVAEKAARVTEQPELITKMINRNKKYALAYKETQRITPFLEKLKSTPEDPQANLIVGKSWCLVRDRWEKGLPYLVKSQHPFLAKIAKQDMAAPKKIDDQIRLAEDWWKAAKTEKGQDKLYMLRRAFQWYQQAIVQLDGKEKTKALARVKQLAELLPKQLQVSDIAVTLKVFEGHTAEVLALTFSPNGRLVASGGADNTVRIWDLETGKEVRKCQGHFGTVFGVVFSPDGKHLYSCSEDKTIRKWDVETAKELQRYAGATDYINGVAISPDGKWLAGAGQDQFVRIWDVESGKQLHAMKKHARFVFSVAFSPDGKNLASASSDRTVRIWGVKTGQEQKVLEGHMDQVLSVVYSPDGSQLLTASEDETVKLWDATTGKLMRTYKGHNAVVGTAVFSPDGVRFLSGSDDQTLKLWDVRSGEIIRTLTGHKEAIYRVVVSSDGRRALSCGLDKTIRLWGEK
ncbi:MAG: WD40 repeat domain-containing protein [Gemmataceae bacterium]